MLETYLHNKRWILKMITWNELCKSCHGTFSWKCIPNITKETEIDHLLLTSIEYRHDIMLSHAAFPSSLLLRQNIGDFTCGNDDPCFFQYLLYFVPGNPGSVIEVNNELMYELCLWFYDIEKLDYEGSYCFPIIEIYAFISGSKVIISLGIAGSI